MTGLGRKGALEVGFTFHRYGFPILPGSSVKGIARAYAHQMAGLDEKDADFVTIFGRADDENEANSGVILREMSRFGDKGKFDDYEFETGIHLHEIDSIVEALDLYSKLGNVRNTLLHAGKRPSQVPAQKLEKQVRTLCEQLNNLPIPESKEDLEDDSN